MSPKPQSTNQSGTASAVYAELDNEHAGSSGHRALFLPQLERRSDVGGAVSVHVLLQPRLGAADVRRGRRGGCPGLLPWGGLFFFFLFSCGVV